MERPALRRLLADIEARKVDMVVVYKVDRLSRSLLDFARLIEAFEKRSISFVSVTQQFNTATSMGRLVLNVLLSFAQFEREMIAERTRDKMAAARRKGKWVGGCLPFGYDLPPNGRKLVVNQNEARQIREMFALYLEERSLLRVTELVNGRGWRTKSWTTKKDKRHVGSLWEKSTLRRLLTNVTYIGKVDYGGKIHEGEHQGIVEPDVFTRVSEMLDAGRGDTHSRTGNKHGFLLRGLVRCAVCKSVMTSSTSTPRGTCYRYYVCTDVNRRGTTACSVRSVPAEELERFVVGRISEIGKDPALLRDTLAAVAADRHAHRPALEEEYRALQSEHQACRNQAKQLVNALATHNGGDCQPITEKLGELDERAGQIDRRLKEISETLAAAERATTQPDEVARAMSLFDPVWNALSVREKTRLLHLLVDNVEYDGKAQEVAITLRPAGIMALEGAQDSKANDEDRDDRGAETLVEGGARTSAGCAA